jgi:hypothetical protein
MKKRNNGENNMKIINNQRNGGVIENSGVMA